MRIDFHAHHMPEECLKILRDRTVSPRIVPDPTTGRLIILIGDEPGSFVDEATLDLQDRIKIMDSAKVDVQVLSLPIPGVDLLEPNMGINVARSVNDAYARICEKSNGRFSALATLPMQTPDRAVEELRRAVSGLGLAGAMIYSNVAGKTLDSAEFFPLFREAATLGVPIMIHPTTPVSTNGLTEYGLVYSIGFLFDTTTAILRLIFSGLFEKLPNLKLVLPHLGGAVPYLLERINVQAELFPESKNNLRKKPSEYFKQVYVDTVSLHPAALLCAYSCLDHDKILYGSDYPFWSLPASARSIEVLHLSQQDEEKTFWLNASGLLKDGNSVPRSFG